MIQIHASCVAIDGAGLLLRGPSGCGKSDLALRLLDAGAVLVADDRVDLTHGADAALLAAAPPALAGLLEVRGLGVLAVPHMSLAPIRLLVDLVPADQVQRLPLPRHAMLHGVRLPCLSLAPFHASAPAALRLAMRTLAAAGPLVPGEPAWAMACHATGVRQ
ncbi:hypothetical protein [Niveispirillum sp. BGYR6]|uniref:HPr kinase/phosphorylase n=1 Tax=Niveispirillum sp. BGYR6 TaxID=2971249 RepID=UPI0022B95A5C|nr:hypothetical protein [Niveispirillum sp. BGYR6]MDG5496867.1 hypothetical protein [Niveispirillum sp. BGYR6]